jgi:hypothetical protein
VLLVRVAEEEGLELDTLGACVLRTAHPLQACERARVIRPLVIVVGRNVRPADVALLWSVAEEIRAVVVELAAPLAEKQAAALVRQSMLVAAQTRSTGT